MFPKHSFHIGPLDGFGVLTESLNEYFQKKVSIPRARIGEQQEIKTLINEEALLFAKYVRNERQACSMKHRL
jgi:hypothetical protein